MRLIQPAQFVGIELEIARAPIFQDVFSVTLGTAITPSRRKVEFKATAAAGAPVLRPIPTRRSKQQRRLVDGPLGHVRYSQRSQPKPPLFSNCRAALQEIRQLTNFQVRVR